MGTRLAPLANCTLEVIPGKEPLQLVVRRKRVDDVDEEVDNHQPRAKAVCRPYQGWWTKPRAMKAGVRPCGCTRVVDFVCIRGGFYSCTVWPCKCGFVTDFSKLAL